MRKFYVVLIDHCIVHGRVYLNMSQEFLHLLNRHPLVDGHSSQCATELVRMHSWNIGLSANLAQPHLYTGDLQPMMRIGERDKQGFVLIASLV